GKHDASWIGLTLANQQHWSILPLGLDLYDGLPGVALFLAYLGEAAGEARYTALAQRAVATLQGQLKAGQSLVPGIGGFCGWGGIVYALTHLGSLWDQPALLAEAEAIVELIPTLVEGDEQFDIISGAAGCIGGLLALYRCVPRDRTLAAAAQCGHHLLTYAQPMPSGLGWLPKGIADRPLTGFSHGAAGIAWALLQLAMVTGEERLRAAALAAMGYERSLFSAAEGNWPDLRSVESSRMAVDEGNSTFAMAWCHGAPGIGLSRLLCLRHFNDLPIRSEIEAALQTTLVRGFGNNHSLCHGDLGNLELLLEASLTLGEPRWRADADSIAAMILES
ncbi:MAG TPA: type 2 lanthipeptide synthetase LanM, partial [Candidatus Methylomirabilis sp.]|nr:type 2 lanthipeptide synthetase LanM [Candidatus Methylomirabilis sp.]